jgi:tRNA threonylcarbamoyladenosine biosynthesis protein TsaE
VADPAAVRLTLPTAADTWALGRALAGALRAGDLVLLTGELGAGKTTLARGLGTGLGVRGDVTSPTFVIARVHPSLGAGPALVHVDAYRLGGLDELEDLDLEASLEESVTVVEWGAGLAEGLSADRLEIEVRRPRGRGAAGAAPAPEEDLGSTPRTAVLQAVGERWSRVDVAGLAVPVRRG